MIISIGSDHGGFLLKEKVVKLLEEEGFTVINRGSDSTESVDYPLYGMRVCNDIQNQTCDFGVLICTTGVGMSIVANKHRDVRAVLAQNVDMARLSREHNNCNCLCVGSKYFSDQEVLEMVREFVGTEFAGDRHERRVNMINKLEEKQCQQEK